MILIDEISQSQAEYTTMALRAAPGAIVIGSTTAGADGNVSPIPLPGGLSTMISGIGIFYPDKRPTQRIGIVPDIEVHPTVAGLREGRDELLEAAVRTILGGDTNAAEIAKIVPTVDPTPSVIESPSATMLPRTAGPGRTSTPSSQNHEFTYPVKAALPAPAWFPAATNCVP